MEFGDVDAGGELLGPEREVEPERLGRNEGFIMLHFLLRVMLMTRDGKKCW